jgi:predicted MPP superfamily phosphohydrolase
VILGGDITDERTSAEDMKRIYEMIGSLGLDVFFVYGNHDLQSHGHYLSGPTFTPEELEEAITGNGIKILRDEMVQWADDLVILGREDGEDREKRMKVDELPERPGDAYVICADHTPYIEDDILATGADLQLSGHTHAGQLFPLKYVYKLGVRNIYGEYKRGDTTLYVSPGISGWYFPFRTQAYCNYEVIKLSPER